jgi:hypothetical protein
MIVYIAVRTDCEWGQETTDYFYTFQTREQAEEFVNVAKDDPSAPKAYWQIYRQRATHRSGASMAAYHLKASQRF